MEINTYAIIPINDGAMYSVHVSSPLLAAIHVFDSLEDAREYAETTAKSLGLHKGNDEPSEMDTMFGAMTEDIFRKREHGPLYLASRQWNDVYVPARETERAKDTCRRLSALNPGFKWEASACGADCNISVFANWWELEEVMA